MFNNCVALFWLSNWITQICRQYYTITSSWMIATIVDPEVGEFNGIVFISEAGHQK